MRTQGRCPLSTDHELRADHGGLQKVVKVGVQELGVDSHRLALSPNKHPGSSCLLFADVLPMNRHALVDVERVVSVIHIEHLINEFSFDRLIENRQRDSDVAAGREPLPVIILQVILRNSVKQSLFGCKQVAREEWLSSRFYERVQVIGGTRASIRSPPIAPDDIQFPFIFSAQNLKSVTRRQPIISVQH